mmetsp:Transcript_1265/g.2531  ORF Transcript_1265/g.2531 Transcript_1265/m.2531 type:complete len:85 (-) Transcript_1265:35-289(-)
MTRMVLLPSSANPSGSSSRRNGRRNPNPRANGNKVTIRIFPFESWMPRIPNMPHTSTWRGLYQGPPIPAMKTCIDLIDRFIDWK